MIEKIKYDVIIIGAGQCGIALAYYLEQANISYLIIEKSRPFSSWYQRWESFNMNTANWMNVLPGVSNPQVNEQYNRSNKQQIIETFINWQNDFSPNINIDKVLKIERVNSKWNVTTDRNSYKPKIVVLAVGLNKKYTPDLKLKAVNNIKQLHSINYISPTQISTNRVLIIGSGSSGVQICEDLAKTNKYSIILSCSKNKSFSWSYLGISIHRYAKILNVLKIPSSSIIGQFIKYFSMNKGDPATPPNPKELRKKYNVKLMKRLIDIQDSVACFEGNKFILLDDITIIWCTGYQVDYKVFFDMNVQSELLGKDGHPILRTDFESSVSNLYFIGLRFQRLLSSHIIYGAVRDADALASEIHTALAK